MSGSSKPDSLTPQMMTTNESSSHSSETHPDQEESSESPSQLSTEQWNAIRLLLIMDQVVCPILKQILLKGAQNKKSDQTLEYYLIKRKLMSKTKYRDTFDKCQRNKIESDPSCATFDITLLILSIKHVCDDLAKDDDSWKTEGTFENLLKKLKDHRNDLMHNQLWIATEKFKEKLEDIRTHLLGCSKEAYSRYDIDYSENEANAKINSIRDNSFADLDLNIDNNILLFERLKRLIEDEGRKDFVHLMKRMLLLNPASMIAGYDIQLAVSSIFTELEIVKAGRTETSESIRNTDILQYALKKNTPDLIMRRQAILIEGSAGSGKTTLLKFLMSDWISGNYSVKEIGKYKLIIHTDFRNTAISSFQELLSIRIPSARKAFPKSEDMLHCLLDLPFMIFMDGMDEMNDASKKLYKEILDRMEGRNCTLLCTSRPEKVEEFYLSLPDDFNVAHLKIKGVPNERAEEFLERYHTALIDFGIGQEDTEDLLNYFRTRRMFLGDFWKLPLNLSLFSLLWSLERDKVKITTVIELLRDINHLINKKLLERLYHKDEGSLSLKELKTNLAKFVVSLHRAAFTELCNDAIVLREETLKCLESVCSSLSLHEDEVISAFLNRENIWSSATETSLQVSFPQRTWQEFYSSLHICKEVMTKASVDNETLLRDITDTLSRHGISPRQMQMSLDELQRPCQEPEPVKILDILSDAHRQNQAPPNLNKFQNVLMMLIGVFYESKDKVNDSLITEVVELIKMAGVKDRALWIQVLNNVKCDGRIARLIAQMPGIIEGPIRIRKQDAFAYAALLKEKRPESITVEITGKSSENLHLRELLQVIGENGDYVKCLSLNYMHGNSVTGFPLSDVVDRMMERCRIREYKGPLSPDMKLSETIKWLDIRIDNQASFENLHTHLSRKLNHLEALSVCLPANLDPQLLKPLPRKRSSEKSSERVFHLSIDLLLLDIHTQEDFKNAAAMARKLQPVSGNRMFRRILFPRMVLNSGETELNLTQFRGIRTCTVEFPSSLKFTSEEDRRRFEDNFKRVLGCRNVIWRRKQHFADEW